MSKLVWRVKLVAEHQPGVTTETELAYIECDAQAGLASLAFSLAEVKQLTAALQAEIVPVQVAALGECPRACLACWRRLASKGYSRARFRSLFGDVPVRVRRLVVCPCQGEGEAKSVAVLDFGRAAAVAPVSAMSASTRSNPTRTRFGCCSDLCRHGCASRRRPWRSTTWMSRCT